MSMLPSIAVCEQARRARDPRFDGVFFTAVKTTGIYCRPVCPAMSPKAENVTYYATAAGAEAAGYRPCLRCRPELSPAEGDWRRGDALVARAVRLIEDGALDSAPLSALADHLHVGERHLRRLVVDTLGASPQQLQATRRLLFAKQLLTDTALPMTEVAQAAGFGSLRRFNDAFRNAYAMPPGRLRVASGRVTAPGPLTLRLGYRPPFDFRATLAFLRMRALPGLERIDTHAYARVLDAQGSWLQLSEAEHDASALQLQLHGVRPAALPAIVRNVRRMFDLDADPHVIGTHLARDAVLAPLLRAHPGLRLPGGWSVLEVAVRAVLGQQVSVAAAHTLAKRLLSRHGQALDVPVADDLHSVFPSPARLADADLDGLGLTGARIATLRALARALAERQLDGSRHASLDDAVAAWTALPGIGPWTAHYIALRGLLHPDAFPAGDLVLRKQVGEGGHPVSEAALRLRAEHWRPWRAYAAIHLWHAATRSGTRA